MKKGFKIKDSGKREEMKTGSVRDVQIGKPRPDLIPPSFLVKLAMHYGEGSKKYGDSNWKKGQNIMRFTASFERHLLAYRCGMTDEPHLIAAIWNLVAIDWTLDAIRLGNLPAELDDRPLDEREGNQLGQELYKMINENVEVLNS